MNTHFCVLIFCIWLSLLFQERNFLRKKVFLLIDCGIPRDSQSQYLVKCVGDQRCQRATILIWYWEALVGSAIWNILAHQRLWSSHALWHDGCCFTILGLQGGHEPSGFCTGKTFYQFSTGCRHGGLQLPSLEWWARATGLLQCLSERIL